MKQKLYSIFFEATYRFYIINKYLPRKTTIDRINSKTKIINIIIDTCCLINNETIFENNNAQIDSFFNNQIEKDLLYSELLSLFVIICLTHFLNFDNEEISKSLFYKIFEKINEFKKYKESLSKEIYSPHLTIIRCYSIFLNRFCFNHSIKHECDLLDSFNHFINIFPQAKELNEFIFQELISYFSFMIMVSDYINYFNTNLLFIKSDISLMKYLMTQPEIINKFNIKEILSISDINSSNKFLQDLLNDNTNNIELFDIIKEKNLKFSNSIIEFLF